MQAKHIASRSGIKANKDAHAQFQQLIAAMASNAPLSMGVLTWLRGWLLNDRFYDMHVRMSQMVLIEDFDFFLGICKEAVRWHSLQRPFILEIYQDVLKKREVQNLKKLEHSVIQALLEIAHAGMAVRVVSFMHELIRLGTHRDLIFKNFLYALLRTAQPPYSKAFGACVRQFADSPKMKAIVNKGHARDREQRDLIAMLEKFMEVTGAPN